MNKKPARRPAVTALFLLTILLTAIGLLFVWEASGAEAFVTFGDQFYFVKQQLMWLVVGCGAFAVGYFMPIDFWRKMSPLMYVTGILLLIAVFIPGLGKSVNGARRWLDLGKFSFQPVEVIKFSVITFFATWMEKHQKLPPFLFLTALPAILLMRQPDMGSTLIVLSVAIGIYFLAGAKMDFLIKLLIGGAIVLAIAVVLSPYRLKRVTTFLNPEADPLGASFHIHQITLALGNGGWFGRGLGQSRQKFSYIPEASTDSIFAIVAEEVGFVGSLFLFSLFAAYLWLAHRIWRRVPKDTFAYLLTGGLIIWIGMQICLNLAAIVALVPLTGIPLPFFSYGGTALVMVLFGTGILLGIGRSTELAN